MMKIFLLIAFCVMFWLYLRKSNKPNDFNTAIIYKGHWSVGEGCFYNSYKGGDGGSGFLQMFDTLQPGTKFIKFSGARAIYKITNKKYYSDFGSRCVAIDYKDVGHRKIY